MFNACTINFNAYHNFYVCLFRGCVEAHRLIAPESGDARKNINILNIN